MEELEESCGGEKRRMESPGAEESSDEDDRLMDDDYQLLEENLGIRFRKRFKRVKVIDDDDSDEEEAGSSARNQIADELFDLEDESEVPHPTRDRSPAARAYPSEESSEDEIDDFIVDDSGAPVRRVKMGEVRVTDDRIQAAQDIFGLDFDMTEFAEAQNEDEYEDSEEEDQPRRRSKVMNKKMRQLHEIYEPSDLERFHFTKADAEYTKTDIPERNQRRKIPRFNLTEFPMRHEAVWIFEALQKVKKKLGTAYENDDLEDISTKFDQSGDFPNANLGAQLLPAENERGADINTNGTLMEDDNWDKESSVAGGQKASSTVAADDDDWDKESTVSQQPAKAVPPTTTPATAEDDDDEWGSSSDIVSPSIVPPSQAKSAVADDDDDWDTSSFHGCSPMPATPKASQPVLGRCDENADARSGISANSAASEGGGRSDVISSIVAAKNDEAKKNDVTIDKIEKVLKLMKFHDLEMPFIKRYKKDYYRPELTERDLWTIARLDISYCELHKSKMTLMNLLNNTMEFMEAEGNQAKIEALLGKKYRNISPNDFDIITELKSIEEVNDYRGYFTLHYGPITSAVKAFAETNLKGLLENDQRNVDGSGELVMDVEDENNENGDANAPKHQSPLKRPSAGRYEHLRRHLADVLPLFGMTAADFAINVRDAYAKVTPIPAEISYLDATDPFISQKCPSREMVMESATFLLASQISRELEVRKAIRSRLAENAGFTVTPTESGKKIIDETHPLYAMKYLRNKPIQKFVRDEFLKLMIGEQEKLVEVSISEEFVDNLKDLFEEWVGYFCEDGFSSTVEGWNRFKRTCIYQAVFEMTLPSLVKELKLQLENDSKDFVVRACRRKIRKIINVGKFEFSFSNKDADNDLAAVWSTERGIRVLAIAYDSSPILAPFACVLNPDGSLADHLALNNFVQFGKSTPHQQKLKAVAMSALRDFIKVNKPHVIIIGGESLEAYDVEFDVKELLLSLSEDDDFPSLPVEIMDNDVAKVFSYSIRAKNEFREYPVVLSQAISLARRLLDPLVETGQLYNSDEDILCLKLHPLQTKMSKEALLVAIEDEFVSCVNDVGVDFNLCLRDNRAAKLLQFVGGLGPSKASFLLQFFTRKATNLKNRAQFHEMAMMGPTVFRNCSGFIRVNWRELSEHDDVFIEYLDCMRVHPEYYSYARQIAGDAFAEEDEDGHPIETNLTEDDYVKLVLDDPVLAYQKIGMLNMKAFAHQLIDKGIDYQRILLEDIQLEYFCPFKDPRPPYVSPSVEEIFSFLTKETAETLYKGKLVIGVVTGFPNKGCSLPKEEPIKISERNWQCPVCKKGGFQNGDQVYDHYDTPGGVFIKLDNGLLGFISSTDLSDKAIINVSKRVCPGQPVYCRIESFVTGTKKVKLISKSSVLQDEDGIYRPPKDAYYDKEREDLDRSIKKKNQTKRGMPLYRRRAIVHPSFHNISYDECSKRLESMEIGDAIFRPSSKGTNHITLSWKVMNGQLQHVDIEEKGKGGGVDELSLGPLLVVDGEEYEDLDEILTRYVFRISSNVREVLNHKNYVDFVVIEDGNERRKQAEEILKKRLSENPYQLHYMFSVFKQCPGRFLLSYSLSIKRNRFAHEVITVVPDGFRYRGHIFESFGDLLRHFKSYYRDVPGNATPHSIGSASDSSSQVK